MHAQVAKIQARALCSHAQRPKTQATAVSGASSNHATRTKVLRKALSCHAKPKLKRTPHLATQKDPTHTRESFIQPPCAKKKKGQPHAATPKRQKHKRSHLYNSSRASPAMESESEITCQSRFLLQHYTNCGLRLLQKMRSHFLGFSYPASPARDSRTEVPSKQRFPSKVIQTVDYDGPKKLDQSAQPN